MKLDKEAILNTIVGLLNHNCIEENSEVWKFAEQLIKAIEGAEKQTDFPKIICICGSTRFADWHAIMRWELEKDGKAICLMINYLPAGYFESFGNDHYGEKFGNKEILDELHKRKIDLADEVFIINKDGYIGESTRSEIEYAIKNNKPVKYLEPRGVTK